MLRRKSTGSWKWVWFLEGAIAINCAIDSQISRTYAQSIIVPDNTLSAENSIIVPNSNGLPREVIDGGTIRGQNLFHSFQEFNVSAGREAYFFSPNAGNIKLHLQDLLLLRQNSNISTTAGIDKLGGNGGNVTINAKNGFIVAVPKENSNITANAFTGEGGRVEIAARSILGIQPRLRETLLSDITASSEFGVNGEVTVNQLEPEPNGELVELPVNLLDVSRQIATGCNASQKQTHSSFIATGRGGVASNPTELLMGDAILTEWVTPPLEFRTRASRDEKLGVYNQHRNTMELPNAPSQIVEASSWLLDNNGDVILIALAPHSPISQTEVKPLLPDKKLSCEQTMKREIHPKHRTYVRPENVLKSD